MGARQAAHWSAPIANPKKMVSLRLDPDLLAALQATGPGWQSRVNAMLRDAVMR